MTELLAEVDRRLPRRVRFDRELPRGIGLLERYLPDGGRVLFFANTGLAPVGARATVDGGVIESWDTVTGQTEIVGQAAFDLKLAPAGSALYVVGSGGAAPPPKLAPVFAPIEARDWTITPDDANVLVLDYCDLAVRGQAWRNINTWRANWTLWQLHGFERPAWDNAVQFQTRIFDRNHFDPASGFEAAFHFDIAGDAARRALELAVETPELYRVALNGHELSFSGAAEWLDPHIRSVSVEKWARTGENVVTIAGRPFDVRMELENIYLRGNFSVAADESGFRLAAPKKLDFGSWRQQGYPFYGNSVAYQTEVEVPAGSQVFRVKLSDWAGSVAEVRLDGERRVLGWQPWLAEFPAAPGRHTVTVRVVSTPRNIFGPFHNPSKPRMRAWPAAWAEFPEHQPPPAAYDLLDYGLMARPVLEIAKEK